MSEPQRSEALFVSPHFDDVALSCGGTVALAAHRNGALVLTVFAGKPSGALNPFAEFQHRRWGHPDDAVDERRQEDEAAMAILGSRSRWLDFLDAIYRDELYLTDEALFGPVKPADGSVAQAISRALVAVVAEVRPTRVYLPLGVGNHVDHQICYGLGHELDRSDADVLFYEDFPYVATPGLLEARLQAIGRSVEPVIVSITETIDRRIEAIRCYASQLPTIFRFHGQVEAVVRQYAGTLAAPGYAERFWRVSGE